MKPDNILSSSHSLCTTENGIASPFRCPDDVQQPNGLNEMVLFCTLMCLLLLIGGPGQATLPPLSEPMPENSEFPVDEAMIERFVMDPTSYQKQEYNRMITFLRENAWAREVASFYNSYYAIHHLVEPSRADTLAGTDPT